MKFYQYYYLKYKNKIFFLILLILSYFLFMAINSFCIFKKLAIHGTQKIFLKQIENICRKYDRQTLSSLPFEDIYKQIINIEWIDKVILKKSYPHTLLIQVKEKLPIAIWKKNNQVNYYVDACNQLFQANQPHNMSKNIITINGENAYKNFNILFNCINKHPEIKKQIKRLNFIRNRRWNLILHKDITVKLPDNNLVEAFHTLNFFLKNYSFREIDLRVTDRVYIK